ANPKRTIESFLANTNKQLIFSRDLNWTMDTAYINVLNAGIYIMRNSPQAQDFLTKAWSMRNFTGHGSRFGDQAILNLLVVNEFMDCSEILPLGTLQQFISNNLCKTDEPLGLHFAGPQAKQTFYDDITSRYIYSLCTKCLMTAICNSFRHQLLNTAAQQYYLYARIKTKHYF
ncbi:hypothetical protein KDA11_01775, partial [Candidatus Saccharibacteria bacterium]|nr:hypothetical protein [Candidatus Saccharibacteria bacterium]